MDPATNCKPDKIKLVEINSYLTCYLCKGYLIDATTISECLHSFCRSCIIKFLQENCYCPVCEVIINKAKPCLKLDKTLQDIVYKLVPGLFVKEMVRRRRFYQERPQLAAKVSSPEERGEDTERTIFNPQDPISLSIEYISDDSAPGAISVPASKKTSKNKKQEILPPSCEDLNDPHDNPMKRFLQCPGMCRIEVLKKFVRNKYNVDTNSFHIDILYKRVPLPDHYTLIDIGYIYSWKRNEPMKFFFRITDINKVAERFDYFDGRPHPDVIIPTPPRTSTSSSLGGNSRTSANKCSVDRNRNVKLARKQPSDAKPTVTVVTANKTNRKVIVKDEKVKADSISVQSKCAPITSEKRSDNNKLIKAEVIAEEIKNKLNQVSSEHNNHHRHGDSVYTNITLNRDDNIEIITKIQKVSNKEGHPIGLNIINHTVKKTNKSAIAMATLNNKNQQEKSGGGGVGGPRKSPKFVRFNSEVIVSNRCGGRVEQIKTELSGPKSEQEREEIEKSNFFKSIQLTAKNNSPKSDSAPVKPSPAIQRPLPSAPSPPPSVPMKSSAQKRKNSSPVKNNSDHKTNSKKLKCDSSHNNKRPVKIIIQPKTIQNPDVRQMVSNVNQNVNSMSKIVDMTTAKSTTKPADLRKIIDNCKINIPASLSITLNAAGESGARTPPSIAPVKNYIEILKLPDSNNSSDKCTKQMVETVVGTSLSTTSVATTTTTTTTSTANNKSSSHGNVNDAGNQGGDNIRPKVPTFQKIFEESIVKKPPDNDVTNKSDSKCGGDNALVGVKRNILEIASQLQIKKSKGEGCKSPPTSPSSNNSVAPVTSSNGDNNKEEVVTVSPPVTSPLGNQNQQQSQQTSAILHSSSLGLNYTVSVAQPKSRKLDVKTSSPLNVKLLSPPLSTKKSPQSLGNNNKQQTKAKSLSPSVGKNKVEVAPPSSPTSTSNLNSNQLLEKYNIQNLAQLTASFNFNPTGQISALQQAMLQHHIERQNWLNNMNQGPLLQYEKYLRSLNLAQNTKLMGNIKEN